ncbi:MAG: NAD(P) transhydrogenase subunit alpha [Leptospiraceae bacterium]|nr:NAD(P) transhydrogenase subunit alpha [Leptospiraceae bacterium]MCB1200610.1 NAD(P) transhydrogenase subunit alpha [Leptospiraceae bacterium]
MADIQTLILTIYVFVLAIFTGFELISKVPPTLHTPLMSGSNAISGITILGALIVAGGDGGWSNLVSLLGLAAVFFAGLNVFGGYVVTDRMLQMFKKKNK